MRSVAVGLGLFSVLAFACGDGAVAGTGDDDAPGSSGSSGAGSEVDGGGGSSSSSGSSGGGSSSSGNVPDPPPDAGTEEGGTTPTEADALCNQIQPTTWSAADAQALLEGVVARFAQLKRDNDALIDERGVGQYVGSNTDTWKAIAQGDTATAIALVQDHVLPGYDAAQLVDQLQGTSCIGRVYRVLDDVYTALGRGDEWKTIEACGRAWQSDGLHVQAALIRSGWNAPTLPIVSDEAHLPGSAEEVALAQGFLSARASGSYYGVPLSATHELVNFLPSPGSSTPRDTSTYDTLSQGTFLAFATLRAAYHVPLIVPGRFVPADVVPDWQSERAASIPFVIESHSYREAWDKTNFQLRPLTDVIAETFTQTAVYSTGTLLFAPHSTYVP